MKIMHFHDSPHLHGGATQYLNQVLQALKAAGHQNHLFSIGPEIANDCIDMHHSFEYHWSRSPLQRRRDFYSVHQPLADKMQQVIADIQPDLIHIHNCANFRQTVFPTILYSELKSVMTVHDFSLNWNSSPQRQKGCFKALLANLVNRPQHAKARKIVLDSVDLFLCPTQAIVDGLALPADKSVRHRLPINPAEASELPQDMLRMFFAGTLFASKGVDILLRALSIARPKLPNFTLEIAGSGDLDNSLVKLASDLSLADNINFLGQLDGHQMNLAYQRANLQVLPSRVPENSPLTVLEAGVRGRPSIASHAGGVPELIGDNRGWTFLSENSADLANILVDISNDLTALATRGASMRKWVRSEFDPSNHWVQLEQHYANLIS